MTQATFLATEGRYYPLDRRSERREVRNPVLGIPAARAAIADMTPGERLGLRRILLAIKADAAARADTAWRKHKAPMAAYWKAVSVIAGHIARALVTGETTCP